jgi:hypothetical protein
MGVAGTEILRKGNRLLGRIPAKSLNLAASKVDRY